MDITSSTLQNHGALGASPWVTRFGNEIEKYGTVLDVACGGGRHANWFAARNHPVIAIDRERPLQLMPGIVFQRADIEANPWPLNGEKFACVVVTNYLFRPLMPTLVGSVQQGGWLIYETFAVGNERFGRPSNPEFLLKRGELFEFVLGELDVVAFEDIYLEIPKPAMIQRIAARRSLEVS